MNVAIHTPDGMKFPNLALMKLAAHHKAQGDSVDWFSPLFPADMVYSSKVFTFTPENEYLPADAVKGGTGYGIMDELALEIESLFPDYSIYPEYDKAIGFLTRGCIRRCPWCIVPEKEGQIRANAAWQDIKRPDSREILFLDNNVLASDWGLSQMESMVGQNIRIDFNQGMDARLVTPEIADLLSRLKWIRVMRFSCDTVQILDTVIQTIERLFACGAKPYRIFIYLLVKDIESALLRIDALKRLGVELFAQPYRDFTNNIEPSKEQKALARWVNRKQIFYTSTWDEYQNYQKKTA